MELWIVGQYRGDTEDGHVAWDFQGVFPSREEAEAACLTPRYFVGKASLGERLPDHRVTWPGVYYPLEPAAKGRQPQTGDSNDANGND